uniref:VWFA domain-containing protein n=1 Tax=Haptolina brevifila TaxID=156173 RepID=A0A7S2IAR2_9EUKA
MTDTGEGNLWTIEMYSVNPSQPYKSIHCRFQGSDMLKTFNGSDATGQCDHCVRSSNYSATCGCTCPPGNSNCSWTFYGSFQFDAKTNGTGNVKSCTCNGKPGPPIPPAPPPLPPKPPPPPGPAPPCKAKLDVVVVLDGSGSIHSVDWQRALKFTDSVVDSFHVSMDQVEIAAVQFGSSSETIIGLSADPTAVKAAVSKTRQMRTGTNTYDGFYSSRLILEHGRKGTKGKIVILLTDGGQNRGPPAKIESVHLQDEGTTIFGIGVGAHINSQELQSWVSSPVRDHYFTVSAFDQLDKVLKTVIANACPH